MSGFQLIKPFLRFMEDLLEDDSISEIMVNESRKVFIEKMGQVRELPDLKVNPTGLKIAVQNIASSLGKVLDEGHPILDARLPDGSRVCAVIPPVSMEGITLSIRKFSTRGFSIGDLIELSSITPDQAGFLQKQIEGRKNILISGGTGTGKTTLLNILTDFVPATDRLVIIEDTAEINISKPNLVRLEAKKQAPIRELLKASLRLRPDRIILGEIRGGEAFDLLQALNTGHSGSMSTIHADSALRSLQRLEACTLQAAVDLPYHAIQAFIADSIQFVVHIERLGGKRYVKEILQLEGYDYELHTYRTKKVEGLK